MSENLCLKLEKYFPNAILNVLLETGKKAGDYGSELFLVGGTVRDLFLGRPNFDIDLVLEGDAVELAKEISKTSQAKLTVHRRFGTANLSFPDFSLDLAMARRETYSRPGALPEVEPGTIHEDLSRRDFSINAMALSLAPGRFGELIDLYHGQEDIDGRMIRILHPDSFIDDATRIFRAIRYEQRLGFELEPQTARLLQRDVAMIGTISGDRLRNELVLLLREECPEKALRHAGELGVLSELSPSLTGNGWLGEKFMQARRFYRRTISYPLYLCLLVYHLSESENDSFIVRMNFPAKLARSLRQILQLKAKLKRLANDGLKPSEAYDLLHDFELQAIQANMIATDSSVVRRHIQLYLQKLRFVRPFLTGQDLIRMGVPNGLQIGELLNTLHQAKIDGKLSTYRDEENLVYDWLSNL